MKFSSQVTDEAEINLAPIVDVVFLMLIFFVVSTSLTTETTLSLELPTSSSTAVTTQPALTLNILANGEIRSQGQVISDLDEWLREAIVSMHAVANENAPSVLLRAEANARHGDVARVLDAVKAAGIQQAAIATHSVQP